MAFAYTILRPAAAALDPPARLPLWRRVFASFLPWVGVSVVVLLVTGFWMIPLMFGAMQGAGVYVFVMAGTGIVMMLLYLHLLFAPWRRFREAVDRSAWPEAGKALGQIRMIVAANLILGIITLIVGGTGRYW
jgi:uncharacterized membrane protein